MKKTLLLIAVFVLYSCNTNKEVLSLSKAQEFYYFSNGHLTKSNYTFKTIQINNFTVGEIIRANDASVWSGIVTKLKEPIVLKEGKRFTIDVFMDHIGSLSFKLEDSKDGGSDTNISVKNTRINEWETLVFNFEDAIYSAPSYHKIALFVDLNKKATVKMKLPILKILSKYQMSLTK